MITAKVSHNDSQQASPVTFRPVKEWRTARQQWTFDQWQALCAVLFNGNSDLHEFLLCHQSPNGKERFNKAKYAVLTWHIEQAYYTVAEVASHPCGIGFYPWNRHTRKSYWGGLDFDVHEGQSAKRARALAEAAVEFARAKSPLIRGIIACTSGKSDGWHVWFFSREPQPIAKWSVYLRKVSAAIGAKIGTPLNGGDCELHPIEATERPRGLRAPGSLNPKDGSFGLIAFDSLKSRLAEWKELLDPKLVRALRTGAVAPKAEHTLFGKLALARNVFIKEACSRYPILCARRRHVRLVQLAGYLVNQCGFELAGVVAARQYREAQPLCKSTFKEHWTDFALVWKDLIKKRVRKFTTAQQAVYDTLTVQSEREAFLILCNWLRDRQWKGESEFRVSCKQLAMRLSMTLPGASKLLKRFCARGILKKELEYVRPKGGRAGFSTTYQWLVQ
jgi:hypothetical protein